MSLLAVPPARRVLIGELEGADQVMLLGDLLALREAPVPEVLERARPFLQELGEALRGRRVVIVPGNHDHQLAGPLLERRRLDGGRGSLQLERSVEPGEPGPAGCRGRLPGWCRGRGRLSRAVAAPRRLRDPRPLPRLPHDRPSAGVPAGGADAGRSRAACPSRGRRPATTRRCWRRSMRSPTATPRPRSPNGGGRSAAARRRLTRETWRWLKGRRGGPQRAAAGAIAYGALATANRVGLRRFRADLSIAELGRAGVRAMAEVVRRLGVESDYVIFGHTHRAGPLGDEPGWTLADGSAPGQHRQLGLLVGADRRRRPPQPLLARQLRGGG